MIKYKKFPMPTKGFEARPVQGQTLSTKEIAAEIEKTVGIPMIRTMSVLNAFVETLYHHMGNGNQVVLDDFGTFKPGLSLEAGKAVVKKVNLIASVQMKERLKSIPTEEELPE